MLLSLFKKLTEILIKSSINGAFANISRRIRNTRFQQSKMTCPLYSGNSEPSLRVSGKVGLRAVRSQPSVAATSAWLSRLGASLGARGPRAATGSRSSTLAPGGRQTGPLEGAGGAGCMLSRGGLGRAGEGGSRWEKSRSYWSPLARTALRCEAARALP